jgi:peroxiredoxin
MSIVKDLKIFSGLAALVLAGYCPSLVSLEIGEQAPNFRLAVLSDSQAQSKNTGSIGSTGKGAYRLVELRDYVGAVVYVDFWASYCLPCRESFPLLSELRDRFNRQTFEVIAVSNDLDPRDAKRFTETYKVSFPVLSDPSGYVAKTYGVKALPMGFLIDEKGVIQKVHEGFQTEDIHDILAAVLEFSSRLD